MINAYIIAKHKDQALPTIEDVYDEQFFISDTEAEQFLEENFPPVIRGDYGVYCVSVSVLCLLGNENSLTASSVASGVDDTAITPAVPVATEESLEDWIDAFVLSHESNPSTEPSDYYFQEIFFDESDIGVSHFAITPKEYFDKVGAVYNDSLAVPEEILPNGFEEEGKSTYEYDGLAAKGKFVLTTLGFVEHRMFVEDAD